MGKTHGCAWRKENVYPDLLASYVEVIFLVYDLMDTEDISKGHITIDWLVSFVELWPPLVEFFFWGGTV